MSRRTVRLPSVLADYACRRTLVCCRPPWRVYLGPQEDVVLRGRLRAAGAPHVAARLERATERPARDVTLIAQPDHGCALLDAPRGPDDGPAGCALQTAAGLAALPLTCRNFPRSIVRTPRGVEVAFLLQCPTAVDLIASAPAPISWVERDAAGWPYDARRAARDPMWWDERTGLTFDALETLRTGWWARLGAATDAESAARALDALRTTPDEPSATGATAVTPSRLDGDAAATELAFLGRLDARGARYQAAHETLAAALAPPAREDELAAALGAGPAAFTCAAAVTLQFAGVHSGQPVADGLRGAGWQVGLAVDLAARLMRLPWLTPGAALRDALTAAAHLARWAAHAQSSA